MPSHLHVLSDRHPHGCPCGRAFGTLTGLWAHQEAKGHVGTVPSDFGRTVLPNRLADDPDVEDWHAMGMALVAVARRVKAGEEIELPDEAAALGISERRLVRALRAHGAIIPEFA